MVANTSLKSTDSDLWSLFIAKGGTVKQLRSISQEQLESIYQQGYSQFETGHYKEALTIFRYLALMDHHDSRFFLAMGLSLSHLNKNAAAVAAFDYASRSSNKDPRPLLAMAESFIQLKQKTLASQALNSALNVLKSSKGWAEEKKIAEQLKHYLTADEQGEKL